MKSTRVLLVEDEPKVATSVKAWLEDNGCETQIAPDGAVGQFLIQQQAFDIVLLDLNLPFVSGFELCRSIRANHPGLPIILVTALGGMEEKLAGFDLGANDYLVKPYDFRELLARMRALLKHKPHPSDPENHYEVLRVADLEINTGFKIATRAGKPIVLTAKEYSLLEYLIRLNGRVASKYEIVEAVWGVNFDTGTNVVEVYINFLRKKIDRDFATKLIHTKQGLGYFISALPPV